MADVTSYQIAEPVKVYTTVAGEARVFEFKGTATPTDEVEQSILAGLVDTGLASIATGKASKQAEPETTEEQ